MRPIHAGNSNRTWQREQQRDTDRESGSVRTAELQQLERSEVESLARMTVTLSCAQEIFFETEYGRHRRRPTTAFLLCLLLGAFGAQTFYLEGREAGLRRLLFCWTLVPAVLALIELPHIVEHVREYNAELARTLLHALGQTDVAPVGTEASPQSETSPLPTTDATAHAQTPASVFAQSPLLPPSAEDLALASMPVLSYAVDASKRDSAHVGPADGSEPEAVQPGLFAWPEIHRRYVQRIVVRKMALDGETVLAEATAERRVPLDGDAAEVRERMRVATNDARAEALRVLAQHTSEEVAEAARRELGEVPLSSASASRIRVR